MRNAGLDEAQAGIKIARRISIASDMQISSVQSLSRVWLFADDTTLMAESEEELKSLWWKWKRRVKSWLKAQHSED